MEKIITAHDMFKNLDNLKYIDLIDANNTFNNITETLLNKKDGLIVCQKENFITNEKAKYQCCYYNTNDHKCKSDHYIIIISGKNITYESGFVIKSDEIEIRDNMLFTVINRKKINNNDTLNIYPNTKIEIHFPADITTLDSFFDSNYDKNMEYIEKIDFSAFNSSTVKIMSHLFDGCSSLTSIDFTKFDSSAATDMSYMFSGCKSMTSFNLSNFNTELVTNMSNMFSGCNSTTSFNLSNFNIELVTDMSYMFSECNSTELIDVSNFTTKSVVNMSNMFSECGSVSSLNLSSFDTSNTIDMSGMFYGCDNLEILDISNFNEEKCNLYDNIFSNYIKNIKSDKMFKNSFNNNELFYVCQSMFIIRNSFAYNCCEYNIETNECDYIPPTFLDSTIIYESTDLYSSLISQSTEHSTEFIENSEQFESSEINQTTNTLLTTQIEEKTESIISTITTDDINTTENIFLTTIPTVVNTTIPHTTVPTTIPPTTIPTTVPTTIPPATVPTTIHPTTAPKIQTTIPTTVPKAIETSFPTTVTTKAPTTNTPTTNELIKQTTVPTTLTTKVPSTISKTIITTQMEENQVNTTIIKETTENIKDISSTVIEKESNATISPNTTINYVETTIVQNNVISTIIEKTDLPKNENSLVVLLGFSHLKMIKSFFSFFIYFARIKNFVNLKVFILPITITYNTNMRMLKEVEGKCTLNNSYNNDKYRYLCEVNEDTENIKSISIKPDFQFLSKDNIEVIGITSLAKMLMNNLTSIDDKYDALYNSTIYLLDNSTYVKYDKLLFNISGVINGAQPKIENNNLTLMINLQSEEKNITEVECIINNNNTSKENYILNCKNSKSSKTLEIDLQSAISFMDDNDILLINFINTSDSIIKIETENKYYKRFFYRKQTGSLKPGIIAAIVIIIIVVLALTIFLVLYFKNKNAKLENNIEGSTIRNLKY